MCGKKIEKKVFSPTFIFPHFSTKPVFHGVDVMDVEKRGGFPFKGYILKSYGFKTQQILIIIYTDSVMLG